MHSYMIIMHVHTFPVTVQTHPPLPFPQVLYSWMESLRYSPEDYCIATRLPKQLLLDTQKTLQDCGLVSDTTLVVEERE